MKKSKVKKFTKSHVGKGVIFKIDGVKGHQVGVIVSINDSPTSADYKSSAWLFNPFSTGASIKDKGLEWILPEEVTKFFSFNLRKELKALLKSCNLSSGT